MFAQMGGSGEELPAQIVVLLCITHPGEQVGALQMVLARLGDQSPVEAVISHADPSSFESAVRSWLADSGTVGESAGAA
jgi:hypothetical protein